MKYKIKKQYSYKDGFWTHPDPPAGYTTARTCYNCGKMDIASTGPGGMKIICNEVTEYTGVWEDTGIPRGYARQAFYTFQEMTCDEHKFIREMEGEDNE